MLIERQELTLAGDEHALIEAALRGGAVTVTATAPHVALGRDRTHALHHT